MNEMQRRKKIFFIVLCLLILLPGTSLLAAGMPKSFLKTRDPQQQKILSRLVSINFHDAEIEEVFAELKRLSGVDFNLIYDQDAVDKKRPSITLNVKETPLKDVLWFLSRRCRLELAWGPSGIQVTLLDPELKKVKKQLYLGIGAVLFIVILMFVLVVAKRTPYKSRKVVDEVAKVSEAELIQEMFSKKSHDFIFHILALDRLGKSGSVEAREALVGSLTHSDILVRKIALAKLKEKHAIEHIISDIAQVTDQQISEARKIIFEDKADKQTSHDF